MTVLGEQVHIEHVLSEEGNEGSGKGRGGRSWSRPDLVYCLTLDIFAIIPLLDMTDPLIIEAFQHYAVLYIKYMQIFEKLEKCYDSMVHPQKRIDVKMALELVIRRVIELRHMLVKWYPPNPDVTVETGEQPPFPWEYVNLDDILSDLKLPPSTMEVPIPRYFKEDSSFHHNTRDKMVKVMMGMAHGEESIPVEPPDNLDVATVEMTFEEAIEAIQRNERGRQGKQRANFLKDLRDEDRKKKNFIESSNGIEMDNEIAAANIQRLFRGYFSRKTALRERDEELVFIGMKPKVTDNSEVRLGEGSEATTVYYCSEITNPPPPTRHFAPRLHHHSSRLTCSFLTPRGSRSNLRTARPTRRPSRI